jgi:transposase
MPKQKALGAIAHRLLVISYHLLSRRVPYAELGTTPLDQQQVARQRRRLVEQLATLGVKVTVEEAAVAL